MKLLEKIKKIKNWEIYLAVLVIGVILFIYFSSTPNASKDKEDTTAVTSNENYITNLEKRLQLVISNIKDAGKVSVLVMTNGEEINELAYDIEEKTVTQNGVNGQSTTTTTTNKKVLIGSGGSPVILEQKPPEITAIVVVAGGAWDISVKLNIMRAVQAIVGGTSIRIEILN
jgi:stage III sporulation protein AG